MVALDQNSSMISMIKDSEARREPRPTFSEIVEAKVMLAKAAARGPARSRRCLLRCLEHGRQLQPAARHGAAGPRRSPAARRRSAAPLGAIEPGWGVGKIKQLRPTQ
jgi:hypothetical protein